MSGYTLGKIPFAVLLSLAWALSCSTDVEAGPSEAKPVPDKPGTWCYQYLAEDSKEAARQFGMTAAEAATFKPKLDRIAEAFHRNPVLANPKGFDPRVTARIFFPYYWGQYPQEYGYVGEVRVFLEYWFQGKKGEVKQTIEPPQFTAFVNNPEVLMHGPYGYKSDDHDKAISDAASKLREMLVPEKVKELAPGVTLYRGKIVVSNPKRPLYLPVTVGEIYKLDLAYWGLVAKKDHYQQITLDMLSKEQAVLAPGDMERPAYHYGNLAEITPQPNNKPVMRLNPDYFDRTLPKTAVQLITIPVPEDLERKDSDFEGQSACGYLRLYQLARAHDPNQLKALLDTKP